MARKRLEAEMKAWKTQIDATIRAFFQRQRSSFAKIDSMGVRLGERIADFSSRGKSLRGSLVCIGYGLFADSVSEAAVTAAAAVELFQSALLIHDDIMDRDQKRRGENSVYHEYSLLAREAQSRDPDHTGMSLGICAGDVAFFAGFGMLAELQGSERLVPAALSLSGRELSYVGIAQMLDVFRGSVNRASEVDETLGLYRYKTARYTFSLPLVMGSMLAGAVPESQELLERLGESLGVLFQIKDDELGLFGEEEKVGKPVGSDIREGKKTLYHALLMRTATTGEKAFLSSVFGNAKAGSADLAKVRDLVRRHRVPEQAAEIAAEFAVEADKLILQLAGVSPAFKDMLMELRDYCTEREL